jgi:hypothetical protein
VADENLKIKIGADVKAAQAGIRSLVPSLRGLQVAAVGAAIAGFAVMTKKTIDSMDNMRKMSKITGIAASSLSTLKYAVEQSDTSFEAFTTSMRRLSAIAGAAFTGNLEAVNTFRNLGISVRDASGQMKPMQSLLMDISSVFSRMPDGVEKSALAVKIFGRSGTELIPFLNEGPKGIARLTAEAEKFGFKISNEAAEGADKFNDSLRTLGGVAKGAMNSFVTALLPSLNKVTGGIVDACKESGTLAWWFQTGIPSSVNVGVGALGTMYNAVKDIADLGSLMAIGFKDFFTGNWKQGEEFDKSEMAAWKGRVKAHLYGVPESLTSPIEPPEEKGKGKGTTSEDPVTAAARAAAEAAARAAAEAAAKLNEKQAAIKSFSEQCGSYFDLFGEKVFDFGKLFEDTINGLVKQIITTGIIKLIGALFPGGSAITATMPGGAKQKQGTVASLGIPVISDIAGIFGFDNSVNDRMARSAGTDRWFSDFSKNFSDGYVKSALQTGPAMPTPAGGGQVVNLHYYDNSLMNPGLTPGRARTGIRFFGDELKKAGITK